MPTLTVDGTEVTVDPGTTVLQACEEAGGDGEGTEADRLLRHARE